MSQQASPSPSAATQQEYPVPADTSTEDGAVVTGVRTSSALGFRTGAILASITTFDNLATIASYG